MFLIAARAVDKVLLKRPLAEPVIIVGTDPVSEYIHQVTTVVHTQKSHSTYSIFMTRPEIEITRDRSSRTANRKPRAGV